MADLPESAEAMSTHTQKHPTLHLAVDSSHLLKSPASMSSPVLPGSFSRSPLSSPGGRDRLQPSSSLSLSGGLSSLLRTFTLGSGRASKDVHPEGINGGDTRNENVPGSHPVNQQAETNASNEVSTSQSSSYLMPTSIDAGPVKGTEHNPAISASWRTRTVSGTTAGALAPHATKFNEVGVSSYHGEARIDGTGDESGRPNTYSDDMGAFGKKQSSIPGAALLKSGINMFAGFTALDRIPPMLGIGSGSNNEALYPTGRNTDLTIPYLNTAETHDLNLDDAVADGRMFRDSPSPDTAQSTNRLRVGQQGVRSSSPMAPSTNALAAPAMHFSSSTDTGTDSGEAAINRNEPISALDLARPQLTYRHRTTSLDPLTYTVIARNSSEADAKRVAKALEMRGRDLDFQQRLLQRAQQRHDAISSPERVSNKSALPSAETVSSPVQPDLDDAVQEANRENDGRESASVDDPKAGRIEQKSLPFRQEPVPSPTEGSERKKRRSLLARFGLSFDSKKVPAKGKDSTGGLAAGSSYQPANSALGRSRSMASRPSSVHTDIADAYAQAVADSRASTFTDRPKGSKRKPSTPQYVKTRLKGKNKREFSHLFVAQELVLVSPEQAGSLKRNDTSTLQSPLASGPSDRALPTTTNAAWPETSAPGMTPHPSVQSISSTKRKHGPTSPAAVWSLKFSLDGRYLACAGQDGMIRVWEVVGKSYGDVPTHYSVGDQASPADASAGEGNFDMTAAAAFVGIDANTLMSSKRSSRISVDSSAGRCATRRRAAAENHMSSPAPVFSPHPLQEWSGHTADVLDISWSKNNFLLSSSMDKSVRLWHVSRKECLCAFQHQDVVTSIAFHPKDDRYFLSGSLDAKLRLWNIAEKKVQCWVGLPELLTCVNFTSDGKYAIAGTFAGNCLFFDVHDLGFVSKLVTKRSRSKSANGRKITSIIPLPKGDSSEPERILVTSNDSRIRLWNISGIVNATSGEAPKELSDKCLEAKYKGLENSSSQIKAMFSDDGRYVICGSEDRQVHIWQSGLLDFPAPFSQTSKKTADKSPCCEYFTPAGGSHQQSVGIVTCAIFAPQETQAILLQNGDSLLAEELDERLVGDPVQLSPSVSSQPRSSSRLSNPDNSQLSTTISTPSDRSSIHSSTSSAVRGRIIVVADDTSGTIRVYRNQLIPPAMLARSPTDQDRAASTAKRRFSLVQRSTSRPEARRQPSGS